VHDNVLISYEVLSEKREIHLRTKHSGPKTIEHTDIIFRGVEGYYFFHDNFQTIIFDVTEISVESILEDDKARFEEGWRYCWPGAWNESSEAARRAYLTERGVSGFSLSSSFGMSGWILANSMERVLKDERTA